MASTGFYKYGRLRYIALLLLSVVLLSANAQVTRRQLLRSFYKATTYYNAGEVDKAIATYKEIAELAPQYPDTYLRMAEIYDKSNNVESAIVMYRKYISLEMDDSKIKEPSARLRTLEAQLGMEHYEDAEEKQTLQLFAKYNVMQQASQSDVSKSEGKDTNASVDLQLFASDESAQRVIENKQEKPVVEETADELVNTRPTQMEGTTAGAGEGLMLFSLSALVETRNESLVDEVDVVEDSIADVEALEAERLRTPLVEVEDDMASIADEFVQSGEIAIEEDIVLDDAFLAQVHLETTEYVVDELSKINQDCEYPLLTYVKKPRLHDYHISRADATGLSPQTISPQDLLSVLSGKWVSSDCKGNGHETWIFTISQTGNTWYVALDDNSGIYLNDEEDFIDASWNVIKSFWSYDHAMSNQIKKLRAKTVNAEIKNDILSYTFVTEHQQKPRKAVYTWGRNILEGVADFIPFGGVVTQVGNTLINYVSEKDQQKTYTTTLQFYVKALTPNALRCEYIVSERERSSAGEKEIYKDRKACYLYKADDSYGGFDFVSDNEENVLNKKLYTLLKKEAETDISIRYPLAYMYYYGAGTKKSVSKAVHQMQILAEKGDCNRAKAWLIPICYNLSMDEKTYPYRAVRKYFRSYANEALGDLLLANYPYAYSLQADIYMSEETNTDKIVSLYKKAAELGDVYAFYKLGMIYVAGMLEGQDAQKAMQYLTKAAEMGYADAYYEMALLYRKGKLVDKDYEKYVKNLHSAIEMGSVKALKELSEAYYLGMGVEQNFIIANRIKDRYMKASNEEWKEILNVYGYNTL